MKRNELDYPEPPMPSLGRAETVEEEHTPHTFLYVPDLANITGWSTHRVPERHNGRVEERRPMGFRR